MASNLPKKNRTDQMLADQRWMDGFTEHAATVTSVLIDGVAMSSKDIVGMLQARIAASQTTATAKATQAAVAADAAEHAKTRTTTSGLRARASCRGVSGGSGATTSCRVEGGHLCRAAPPSLEPRDARNRRLLLPSPEPYWEAHRFQVGEGGEENAEQPLPAHPPKAAMAAWLMVSEMYMDARRDQTYVNHP
jgi:hypothetical protein